MKQTVKLTSDRGVNGTHYRKDAEIEVDVQTGSYLITRGHAVLVGVTTAKSDDKPKADPKPVETAEEPPEAIKADETAKEEEAPVEVLVPWAEVKAEAKKLGLPIKGSRADLEKAIAEAKGK